jgi:hypothetical protein
MDKSQPVLINNARVKSGQKRKVGGNEGGKCFYCFKAEHYKSDCPINTENRNPEREGGPLFRTDVNTAPGSKKAKKVQRTP